VQIITALTAGNTITFAAMTFAPEFCDKKPPQIQGGARIAEFMIFATERPRLGTNASFATCPDSVPRNKCEKA
jgi:hypothetical protein